MKYIYAIKNNITNRIYIGQTSCVDNRIKKHLRDLISGKHCNHELQKDFDKFGIEFSYYILEEVPDSKAYAREHYWMHVFDTTNFAKGYNTEELKPSNNLDDFKRFYLTPTRGKLFDLLSGDACDDVDEPDDDSDIEECDPESKLVPSYSKVEELVNAKGITFYRMSNDIGIATAVFSEWKRGKSFPKIDKVKKVADYLEVSMDDLLEEKEED